MRKPPKTLDPPARTAGAQREWRWSATVVCLAALGCGELRRAPRLSVEATASRVDVYLAARGPAPREVGLELEAVALRDAAGGQIELPLERRRLLASELRRRATLAGATVPPGSYETVVLRLARAWAVEAGAERDLALLPPGAEADLPAVPAQGGGPVEYAIVVRVDVRRHEAVSLFIDWDVEASLSSTAGFRPVLTVAQETPVATLGLAYVADSATGSVLALDRSSRAVVATGKVGARPVALAAEPGGTRLYVANSGDGSLSVFDTRRNAVDSTIPTRLSAGTCDVAVVVERQVVAAANPNTDTVSLFDVRGFSKIVDLPVGRSPVRLAAVPRSGRVFVANALSDDVTVLDVGTRSVVASVAVESRPSSVVVDRRGREVFVGHETSQNLLVLDATTLAVTSSVHVGGRVTALLADRRRDRVYVARSSPPELAIVDRRLQAVVKRVRLSGPVSALAQPVEGALVYGTSPERGGLVVVNVVLGEEQAFLSCGRAPADVVFLD